MKLSKKVFIYGAPGAGKTTFSIGLQKKLGFPLVEADYLRKVVAQKEKTREEDPFVYLGTSEAFCHFGSLNEENVTKGLKAVRHSMAPYVIKEIEKYNDNLIMEGAFLDPKLLNDIGTLILVITSDENKHCQQYFEHRDRNKNQLESFKAVRIIQNYFLQEAQNSPIKIIENKADVPSLVEKLTV